MRQLHIEPGEIAFAGLHAPFEVQQHGAAVTAEGRGIACLAEVLFGHADQNFDLLVGAPQARLAYELPPERGRRRGGDRRSWEPVETATLRRSLGIVGTKDMNLYFRRKIRDANTPRVAKSFNRVRAIRPCFSAGRTASSGPRHQLNREAVDALARGIGQDRERL